MAHTGESAGKGAGEGAGEGTREMCEIWLQGGKCDGGERETTYDDLWQLEVPTSPLNPKP
jgi:hypothetical protein